MVDLPREITTPSVRLRALQFQRFTRIVSIEPLLAHLTMFIRSLAAALALLLFLAAGLPAQSRTFPVDELRAGMVGIGKTVFEGDRLDQFKVQILGVLRNVIGTRRSLILARLEGGLLSGIWMMTAIWTSWSGSGPAERSTIWRTRARRRHRCSCFGLGRRIRLTVWRRQASDLRRCW